MIEDRMEIVRLVREIHEAAKRLSTCGEPSIEPRANELLALSYSLLWAEAPFEAVGFSTDYE